jgi:capsule polysaccharide export protein KpsC/LpsZ
MGSVVVHTEDCASGLETVHHVHHVPQLLVFDVQIAVALVTTAAFLVARGLAARL